MADAKYPIQCIEDSLIERAGDVVRLFKQRELSIVTAESCTAGLISAVLSQAEGAGDVLHGSFVTYTKANKTTALGVDEELLKEKGSVNEEVVRQLAAGALDRSPAAVAIAVSGILGPNSDEDGNPVGLVFFATCRRNGGPKILRRDFGKSRMTFCCMARSCRLWSCWNPPLWKIRPEASARRRGRRALRKVKAPQR